MSDVFQSVETQLAGKRNFKTPPLHLWHPPFSGDIPIRICRRGIWYHDGGIIERPALVRLFASILRREDDGEYYLVTPVEKWRIQVERHPLLIVDVDSKLVSGVQMLEATLNTDAQFPVNEQYPLFLDQAVSNIAAMFLPYGLTAICTQAAWYRLVDLAISHDGKPILKSGSYEFNLSSD